jgi:hypothetical protein
MNPDAGKMARLRAAIDRAHLDSAALDEHGTREITEQLKQIAQRLAGLEHKLKQDERQLDLLGE